MAPTEGRVAEPERLWGCHHGTPSYLHTHLLTYESPTHNVSPCMLLKRQSWFSPWNASLEEWSWEVTNFRPATRPHYCPTATTQPGRVVLSCRGLRGQVRRTGTRSLQSRPPDWSRCNTRRRRGSSESVTNQQPVRCFYTNSVTFTFENLVSGSLESYRTANRD